MNALTMKEIRSARRGDLCAERPYGFQCGASPGAADAGNLTSLFHQDRSRLDQRLTAQGRRLLDLSATGSEVSEYHIEAAIASVHACAPGLEDTDWERIVSLYDNLMAMRPSPVIALNRAIALAQQHGPRHGLEAIRAIEHLEKLVDYSFYWAALKELEFLDGRHEGSAARVSQCCVGGAQRHGGPLFRATRHSLFAALARGPADEPTGELVIHPTCANH